MVEDAHTQQAIQPWRRAPLNHVDINTGVEQQFGARFGNIRNEIESAIGPTPQPRSPPLGFQPAK